MNKKSLIAKDFKYPRYFKIINKSFKKMDCKVSAKFQTRENLVSNKLNKIIEKIMKK
jgi:hypothetical protein